MSSAVGDSQSPDDEQAHPEDNGLDSAALEWALAKDEQYQPQWDRLTRLMVTVFLIIASVYLFYLMAPVLPVLVIAALIAFILFFPARALTRRTRFTWSMSVALVYLLLIIVIILAIIGLIPVLVEGTQTVADGFTSFIGLMQTTLEDYQPQDGVIVILGVEIDANPLITPLRTLILESIPPDLGETVEPEPAPEANVEDSGTDTTGSDTSAEGGDTTAPPEIDAGTNLLSLDLRAIIGQIFGVLGTVAGALGSVTSVIANLFLAVFISFLTILELPRANKAMSNWIPEGYHREAALIMERLEQIWTRFFAGQFVIAIIIGLLTFLQLTLMGVQSAVVLAVLVAVLSLLPTIGGFLALIPLFIVPVFQGSTVFLEMSNFTFALLVVGINLAITQIIWNVVAPKILGDALQLPVVVIIVGVFVGAAVGGILGAFLATPLISTGWLFFNYLIRKIAQKDPFPGKEPRIVLGKSEFAEPALPTGAQTR